MSVGKRLKDMPKSIGGVTAVVLALVALLAAVQKLLHVVSSESGDQPDSGPGSGRAIEPSPPARVPPPQPPDDPPELPLKKHLAFEVVRLSDERALGARDIAVDDSLYCINTAARAIVANPDWLASKSYVRAGTSWKDVRNGTGITTMVHIPGHSGIFALQQDRVARLVQGDTSWTTIYYDPEISTALDFTVTTGDDLVLKYSANSVMVLTNDGGRMTRARLEPPSTAGRVWTFGVGGGRVLAAAPLRAIPVAPQLWDGRRWEAFDGGAIGDTTADEVNLDDSGQAALLRLGDGRTFVRPPGAAWRLVQGARVLVWDADGGVTFVGTAQGTFYLEGDEVRPLGGGTEYLEAQALVDVPGPGIFLKTDKGFFEIRSARRG